ncbi:tetratricopeptide repeat protein [Alloalcanivorax sp. C16-2]|uniref:tetratricopeptide repeat protein n=1 Tax=Alloalcanivorax sp. C16-2 TaxID=3390052 RepID=UPI0039708FF8
MFDVRLLIYALLVELAAIVTLLAGQVGLPYFIAYLAIHGFAATLMATGIWLRFPRSFRDPPLLSWLLVFSVAFFVPVLGVVGLIGGVLLGYILPAPRKKTPFVEVPPPAFTPVQASSSGNFRQGDLKTLLLASDAPTEVRLQGMLTVRNMPTRVTGGVLRETLGDRVDDVRLLAYGILDQKEKALTGQIDRALTLLESAGPARHYRLYRSLAELYWELHFQDLVQGDIRELALRRALEFTDQALAENDADGGLWLLRGRIMMSHERLDEAGESFQRALDVGLSPSRVNPWLAELALWRGQYVKVRALMTVIAQDTQFNNLSPSARYWSLS